MMLENFCKNFMFGERLLSLLEPVMIFVLDGLSLFRRIHLLEERLFPVRAAFQRR